MPAVPRDMVELAAVPGYPPEIRFWGDDPPGDVVTRVEQQRLEIFRAARLAEGEPLRLSVLVLSGGGSDGAFGAGLLGGWTDSGTRPEFALVTGISTGAIIAPFAFLGPQYDAQIRDFYTQNNTDTLLIFTPFAALAGKALALTDISPLAAKMDEAITPELVAEIAEQHRRGRRLQIGTTNLDAQRPVIWDIGAIAATGRADAPELIRKIILASSAIPGAFPPQLITVEAGGQTWSEVHVDGGVTRQLFLLPPQLRLENLREAIRTGKVAGTLYVIRNTKLAPAYQGMELGVVPTAARSISTLIKAAGVADVLVIAEQARWLGVGLNLAAVPEDFDEVENELFDPVYMRALYELGYRMARQGYPWTDGLAE